jgi:lysophospholipase L1-like esterase
MKKKKNIAHVPEYNLTPAKRRIFFTLMIALPFLCLIALEAGLQVFHYGTDLSVFVEGPSGYSDFFQCNPDIALRYFTPGSVIPNPPQQLFRKNKPTGVYRIFVLGESSVIGYPYVANASFPKVLERMLEETFPDKQFEVVSVAMSAINSYALVDQIDEVLKQSPDALLIYTGHNEYYGALGVGSVQTLGKIPWLIRTSLRLQTFKSFILLRNFLDWTKTGIVSLLHPKDKKTGAITLMESVVAEQTIPYGGSLYEAGKKQFEENMDIILRKASAHGTTVFLSELVSNLSGQKPFISVDAAEGSAQSLFAAAQASEQKGDFDTARRLYIKAKDYDALRFRAPEEFNSIIHALGKKYSFPVVPMTEYFAKNSPNGIYGNNLFLEHLHPNHSGYHLMATAFYETMKANRSIAVQWPAWKPQERYRGFTDLDSVFAWLNICRLKNSWPFQPKSAPNLFLQHYRPVTIVEQAAYQATITAKFNMLEQEHQELGDYYARKMEFDSAFAEYDAARASLPHAPGLAVRMSKILALRENYSEAYRILYGTLQYIETPETDKLLGIFAFYGRRYTHAIPFLLRAEQLDLEVQYCLSYAYYMSGRWDDGERLYRTLAQQAPRSKFFADLTQLRSALSTQRR